ncbi:MAG: aminopeptidase [Carboxylicivirga sp.]|nr:aminopeptidase [Carboxylicivirga sp.]
MRNLLIAILIFLSTGVFAQNDGYKFTTLIDLDNTSVKDQNRTGTCWSFSGISFVESEIMRMGGAELDLSEMFVVHHCYDYKGEKYIRMHSKTNFGAGGAFADVFWAIKKFGIITESSYSGLNYGEDAHVHGELDKILKSYLDVVVENRNKKLTTVWKKGFESVVDTYLGEIPETFEYSGKQYTPLQFRDQVAKINVDDYVSITSFNHHPFYSKVILEIPDNWLWDISYNVPIDDLNAICKNAMESGYTVAWAGDVSEMGFSHKEGVAAVPDINLKEMSGTERSRWETGGSKSKYKFNDIMPEKNITQEMRQQAFDNYTTGDDHGMHMVGMAKDQNGNLYYKIKNSWNTDNSRYDGYIYMSETYVAYKTTTIFVHKNSIPKNIRKKLGM